MTMQENKNDSRKNWSNLLRDICPLCDYRLRELPDLNPLYPNVKAIRWRCESPTCNFQIGDSKKRSIVAASGGGIGEVGMRASPRRGTWLGGGSGDEEEGNLSALNNL